MSSNSWSRLSYILLWYFTIYTRTFHATGRENVQVVEFFFFCLKVVVILLVQEVPAPRNRGDFIARGLNREQLIAHYFQSGYTALQICSVLALHHQICLSIRHLRRLLWSMGLRIHSQHAPAHELVAALRNELRGSGRLLGYRLMWHRLNYHYGLRVSQNITRQLLGILDPEGVRMRSRGRLLRRQYFCSGPNHIWHIDGYDKLKQFGFAIHGAIDGFSRKVLWLYVGPSNNNPQYIAGFFLEQVKRARGVPTILRCDRGTENSIVRTLQIALRTGHDDELSGLQSFMYGRSTSNQRIECFWAQLRRMLVHFWINFFRDMRDRGIFDNTNVIHIESVRFCFTSLLQNELNQAVYLWNNHSIRRQNFHNECPSGKPNLLYHTPEIFGMTDQLKPLLHSLDEINVVEAQYSRRYPQYGCSEQFVQVITEIVGQNIDNFEMPTTADEALALYTRVLAIIDMI